MAANFSYKRNETTSMKLVGYLDTDNMLIEIDNEEKKLQTLLSEFNGGRVTMTIEIKSVQNFDEPCEDDLDE